MGRRVHLTSVRIGTWQQYNKDTHTTKKEILEYVQTCIYFFVNESHTSAAITSSDTARRMRRKSVDTDRPSRADTHTHTHPHIFELAS